MASDIFISKGIHHEEIQSHHIVNEQVRIHAEEGSQSVIELVVEGEVDILIHVHTNATLKVRCLQTKVSTISQKAHLAEGASITFENISLAPVTHHLESRLEGPHARSDINWVFYAKGIEQQKLSANNVFDAAGGGGDITMKGVAEQKAHVVSEGMITIGLKGSGTNAYLTEDVLMLDSTAKVDAIPGLEIKTNDVKASHSATVSKVTPEDLFYFAARGIDEPTARQMYITGFLGELVNDQFTLNTIENKYHI